MSAHTPVPWVVANFYSTTNEIAPALAIWARTDVPTNGIERDAICMISPLDKVNDRDRANADFIVRACNNHAELLDALRELCDYCDEAGVATSDAIIRANAVLDEVRNGDAKAEGK